MKVYKATDKDMKCRGLQYEIGKTVEAEGELKLCENGLHACEAPIDMLAYYEPCASRYFEAEAEDVSDERGDDSKIVARKLTLGAEIGIPGLVNAQIEYTREQIKQKTGGEMAALSGGNMAALSGGDMAALSGGDRAALSGGDFAALSGGYKAALSGGDRAALSGGNMAALSGGYMAALTGGDRAALSGGEGAVLAGLAGAKYKGGMWSVFSAPQFDKHRQLCGNIVAVVDGNKIKPDTWYTLENGEFVEVQDD